MQKLQVLTVHPNSEQNKYTLSLNAVSTSLYAVAAAKRSGTNTHSEHGMVSVKKAISRIHLCR